MWAAVVFITGVGAAQSRSGDWFFTQIFIKRYFLDTLEREVARAHRYRRPLSLVMFDIDHFKKVNDGYGHLAGDYVLKHLAQTVRAKIRREDCFARYGGEEFSIVLPEIDGGSCLPFAEKIRQIVEKTDFKFENVRIPVTISMGIATVDAELTEGAAIIKRADERLYEAKASGRNRVCA